MPLLLNYAHKMTEHIALKIRKMHETDLEMVLAWRNHPEVRRYMLTQHEIAFDEHLAWYKKTSKEESQVLLVIEESREPIGCVIFSGAQHGKTATWSFYAAPNRKAGTGNSVCSAALDFAFNKIGVHKVAGQVLDFNVASIRIHERLGFVREGLLREHCIIKNERHNLVCFGILRNDWLHTARS